jgi:hypothetical protein
MPAAARRTWRRGQRGRRRKHIRAIEKAHADGAPPAVYRRYRMLTRRHDEFVARFNDAVDRHTAILEADCTQ